MRTHNHFPSSLIVLILAASLLYTTALHADSPFAATPSNSTLSRDDLLTIGIEQHLGREIPKGLTFTDSTGAKVNFDSLLSRKPTLLALVYYQCPNLCTLVLNGTVSSVADLRRTVGDGFQIVVVSIDPTETPALAAQKKAGYLKRYSRGKNEEQEWSFLVGDDRNIHQLADAVGYRYRYDSTIHQYAHGSGVMMIDAQGRVVKYFLGIEYPSIEIEKAVQMAKEGQIGSPVQQFLLLCYCPQRDERLGWTGDAQVFVRTAAFNMDVRGFFHKWVQDIRDSQAPSGGVPCVIPWVWADKNDAGEDGGPAWADAAIICPWTIYLCYADRSILEEHYDSMQRFMAFMEKKRTKDFIRMHPDLGIWTGFGDWLALDGGGKIDGITPHDLIGTAFYAYDAEIMAKVADILGRHDDAKKYRSLHGEIVEAFRRRYVTQDGLVVSGTQTAYAVALQFGLIDESVRARAANELARHIKQKDFHLATGFVGTPYILDVLEDNGHLDVAYKLLEQETFPSWIFPIKNGATTIWERWDGWTPEKGPQDKGMNSYNHYAYGAVGAWMYSTVAGIELDPANPGYGKVLFKPRPGGTITWAEASLETAHGLVAIRWDLKGAELHLQLTVPNGSTASLSLPEGYIAQSPTEFGAGNYTVIARK